MPVEEPLWTFMKVVSDAAWPQRVNSSASGAPSKEPSARSTGT